MKFDKLTSRLRRDYFGRSEVCKLNQVFSAACENGYEIVSAIDFYDELLRGGFRPARRLVVRCDLDTDPEFSRILAAILKRSKGNAAFFFRRRGFNVDSARFLVAEGFSVGYHFEELADFGKLHSIADKENLLSRISEIRGNFARNIANLRKSSGISFVYCASHGDWYNRQMKLANTIVLADKEFRANNGVKGEMYDEQYVRNLDHRISDSIARGRWLPNSPLEVLRGENQTVQILIHPRQWRVSPYANICEDLLRLKEEIFFRLWSRRTRTN